MINVQAEALVEEMMKIAGITRMLKSAPVGVQRPGGALMRIRKFITGRTMPKSKTVIPPSPKVDTSTIKVPTSAERRAARKAAGF